MPLLGHVELWFGLLGASEHVTHGHAETRGDASEVRHVQATMQALHCGDVFGLETDRDRELLL